MAGLIIRGNTYYAVWYDPETGKECRRSTKIKVEIKTDRGKKNSKNTQRSKAQTQANLMEQAAKRNLEQSKAIAAITAIITGHSRLPSIRNYCLEYQHNKGNRSNDKKAIERFIRFLEEKADAPINELTTADCKDYINWLLTDPEECIRPRTIERDRSTLNAIFNRAIDAELLTRNPWKKATVPKETPHNTPDNRRVAFTPEQVQQLITGMPGEWPDLIQMCIYTNAQRLGDVVNLRWEQIDRTANIIRLKTGKTKRNLDCAITYNMRPLLDKLEAHRVDEYLFPKSRIAYTRPGKLSLDFIKHATELGIITTKSKEKAPGKMHRISPLSFHSLRKSFVTVGRSANFSPDIMLSLVGQTEEIQRVYFTPTEQDLSKTTDTIASILLGSATQDGAQ